MRVITQHDLSRLYYHIYINCKISTTEWNVSLVRKSFVLNSSPDKTNFYSITVYSLIYRWIPIKRHALVDELGPDVLCLDAPDVFSLL